MCESYTRQMGNWMGRGKETQTLTVLFMFIRVCVWFPLDDRRGIVRPRHPAEAADLTEEAVEAPHSPHSPSSSLSVLLTLRSKLQQNIINCFNWSHFNYFQTLNERSSVYIRLDCGAAVNLRRLFAQWRRNLIDSYFTTFGVWWIRSLALESRIKR